MIPLINNHYAVSVPEDARACRIGGVTGDFFYASKSQFNRTAIRVEMPADGSYRYLFTSNKATEEDWKKVFDNEHYNYKESGDALLLSKQLSGNFAIIEKIK